MSNAFALLAVPVGNGVAAASDVSNMAARKTVLVDGSFDAIVAIEASGDGVNFVPVKSVQGPGLVTVTVSCIQMRVKVQAYKSGTPTVAVGALPYGAGAAVLAVPAGSGAGASSDVSMLGTDISIFVHGDFLGSATVEVSDDDVNWVPLVSFSSNNLWSGVVAAHFARVKSSNVGSAPDITWVGANSGPVTGSQPFEATTTTIYARMEGSDETGDGTTVLTAYRTFQRAMLDVPHNMPPGARYIVDISGSVATPFYELLPQNYALPSIHGSIQNNEVGVAGDIFITQQSFEIQAQPILSSALPAADAVIAPGEITGITYDATSKLGRIATTKVFVAGALKGQHLIGDQTPQSSCVIWDNTASDLLVANSDFDIPTSGDPFPAGSTLQIVEPSATLEGPASTFRDIGVLNVHDVAQFGLKGVRLQSTNPAVNFPFAPGYTPGLSVSKCIEPYMELCDIAGLFSSGCDKKLGIFSTVIRDKGIFCLESSFAPRRAYMWNISFNFWASIVQIMRATVYEGVTGAFCKYGVNEFLVPGGAGLGSTSWESRACLFRNTGQIEFHGGVYSLMDVKIQGSPGAGILLQRGGGSGFLSLENVAGGTGVANADPGLDDPANAGVGIEVWDGGIVKVVDDDTLITGTLGDMQVGVLPIRTWVNFRGGGGGTPTFNEYDLKTPFNAATGTPGGEEEAGVPAGSGGHSGSRVFQRA